jgi:N-acetylmuramoyl-L-alanine amidase
MVKVVLNVGHSPVSKGAKNDALSLYEFDFNNALSKLVMRLGKFKDVAVVYQDSYANLPSKINTLNPRFTISMHANSYPEVADEAEVGGTEVLYWEGSTVGKEMASIAQQYFLDALGLSNRGIKVRGLYQRGSNLLRKTKSYTIICEPFFIDNNTDLLKALTEYPELVQAYVNIIGDIRTL